MVVALSLMTASCSENADIGTATDGKAVVDVSSGVIETPLDAYLPTQAQRDVFPYALEIKAAECAAAQGVSYTPIERHTDQSGSDYGVWRMDNATKFGYDFEASAAMTEEALEKRELAMSEADRQVVNDCMTRPEMGSVKFPNGRMAEMSFMHELTMARPIDTPRGKEILNEWRSCLKEAGITPPGEPEQLQEYDWIPPEVSGMEPEAQFQTAVADVTCKDQVQLVQREADIQAGMEQKVIDEHASELAAFREVWMTHLDDAQKVIDGYHGD
jgi:hypothetical protein